MPPRVVVVQSDVLLVQTKVGTLKTSDEVLLAEDIAARLGGAAREPSGDYKMKSSQEL